MTGLDWRLAVLALLLGLALGGRGAWLWQANDYGAQLAKQAGAYDTEREAASTAALDQLQVQQDARSDLESRLQAQDATHFKELHDAQQDRARLRDRLATADLRLSVLLAQPSTAPGGGGGLSAATGAVGVVHGAARGELDPAHAQRIVGITGDGDDGLKALQGCQDYVKGVMGPRAGPIE